jgi:hypothetical protein
MNLLMKGDDAVELSSDINVITAEINSFKQIAGQSFFEIGRRLLHVKEKNLTGNGGEGWLRFCESLDFTRPTADRLIEAYRQFGGMYDVVHIPIGKIFEMIYLPETIDRKEFIKTKHIIQSTKDEKTVDEMTVRELREVKKALKEAERQRELAEKDAEILRHTLESIEDQPSKVEVRTEYVEVKDEAAEQKLRKYEELFGDVSMYEGKTTRVTNGDAITYTVFEFSDDVRKFVEKYGHLTHFAREFNEMIGEGKDEYLSAISSMFSLLKGIERNLDTNEAIILNN